MAMVDALETQVAASRATAANPGFFDLAIASLAAPNTVGNCPLHFVPRHQ